jgi:hypothetical protein
VAQQEGKALLARAHELDHRIHPRTHKIADRSCNFVAHGANDRGQHPYLRLPGDVGKSIFEFRRYTKNGVSKPA